MDNIATVRAGFAEQVAILRNRQQWRMSWLYLGTFGSFIGWRPVSRSQHQFPAADFKFAFSG
jgi:NNP family nitrate/nitrite transporter-like MFS transporter